MLKTFVLFLCLLAFTAARLGAMLPYPARQRNHLMTTWQSARPVEICRAKVG